MDDYAATLMRVQALSAEEIEGLRRNVVTRERAGRALAPRRMHDYVLAGGLAAIGFFAAFGGGVTFVVFALDSARDPLRHGASDDEAVLPLAALMISAGLLVMIGALFLLDSTRKKHHFAQQTPTVRTVDGVVLKQFDEDGAFVRIGEHLFELGDYALHAAIVEGQAHRVFYVEQGRDTFVAIEALTVP